MLPAEHARGEALVALARTRFDSELRPIEEQVLRHSCAYEDPPDYIASENTADPVRGTLESNRSPTGSPLTQWQGPELRPALLRWLLTDAEAIAFLEPRGLRIWNAHFTEPLDLTGCRIAARLEFRYCLIEAPILLVSAELTTLTLCNSTLQYGLNASFLKVSGPLRLHDLAAAETLRFDGASIGGEVWVSETTLTANSDCLSLQGTHIANDLKLTPLFHAAGCLYMKGVRVGGFIDLSGAILGATEIAIRLDNATVEGALYLMDDFRCAGEVFMLDIRIGGQLNCTGATLTHTEDALSLDGAQVHGGVFLNGGFECAGAIRLHDAVIGSQLTCIGASINHLLGANMEVKGDFHWKQIVNPSRASLTLVGAKIKALRDDHASWPSRSKLKVNGLVVQDLSPLDSGALNTTGRVAWLNLQPESQLAEPQPWLHLASHFEAKGHKRAAKRVIYELRKHQSQANWKSHRLKTLGRPWDLAVARLEQQLFYILIPILFLTCLSGGIFYRYRAHFAPSSQSAYKTTIKLEGKDSIAPIAYPQFHSFVYALENVLPVVKLGQDDKWAPDLNLPHTDVRLYRALVLIRWLLILSGWIMGGILAAAVSARFRS